MLGRISGRAVGFALPLAAVAILAAACGGGSTTAGSGNAPAPAAPTTASQPASGGASASSGATSLKTETGTAGTFLADSSGRTLYVFTSDQGTTSSCYGGCATAWPPLLTTSGSVGVSGAAVAADLGTTKRTDGTTQVTYAGHPLYYFQNDTSAGMTKGQGVQGVWFMLSPSGTKITKPATAPPATTGGSGGGGAGGGWA